jgi:hypothetical protein
VVLLNLNPGYTPDGPRIHHDPAFATRTRANLCHLPGEYPFYLLDPEVTGPGRAWWDSKLRFLIAAVGREVVASSVLNVEYFPYHSRKFKHRRLALPSQAYGFALVREALARQAVVILLRGERLWLRAVPELARYPFYRVKNWRKPSVSPNNCPDGFKRAVEALNEAITPRTSVVISTLATGGNMNFTDPERTVQLLNELESLGLDDSAFRELRQRPRASIARHREYSRRRGKFQEDGTNARVQERLAFVRANCEGASARDFSRLAREAIARFPF